MVIFIIERGGGNGKGPEIPPDWKTWETRDKCPKCDKPYTKSNCDIHKECDECCYNRHLRQQHLIVDKLKK